jgi:bacillithiol synthase
VRVITDPLGGSELTRAFLSRTAPPDWYPALRSASTQEFLAANAAAVASEFAGKEWLSSLNAAFGGPSATPARARLEKAAANGFVVTTGQQPGLFGGPVYTLSKALTALALANHLEKKTGLPGAPVFWAATDDADFAECSNVIVPSSDGALELRIEKGDDVQRPLADEPLPDIRGVLDEFLRGAGSSSNSQIVELVRRSYEARATIGGSYVTLLRGILEPMGISVLDAAHVEVRAAGHPLLQRALERAEDVARAITNRNAAIKKAGYKVQVREVKGRSLVFRYKPQGKERITVGHAASALGSTKPSDLSATVLLRPVMERAILPTAAYVGGPAEVAYFAQVSAVAEAIGAKPPIVVPRWSGTVLEPRVDRILQRYKLRPDQFSDPHALETRQARESIPGEIQSLLVTLRDAAGSIDQLEKNGKGSVPKPILTGLQRDITHRLERFERRVAAMVKREGTKELHDLQVARASLYPMGKPQERAVSFVALLARYGSDLQSRILEAATLHIAELK